jgi:hypothetical protein
MAKCTTTGCENRSTNPKVQRGWKWCKTGPGPSGWYCRECTVKLVKWVLDNPHQNVTFVRSALD